MNATEILTDQIILKKGRFTNFGFEPCSNAFFDFYVSPKYISPALLKLEDVSFHLFLRKNLNDRDPTWRMPTMRQMIRRLGTGQHRIEAMMQRLDQAHLLKKESGYRKGENGENIPNTYILSDPLQTLEEFLIVAGAGAFSRPLQKQWRDPCSQNGYTPVVEAATPPVAEMATPPVVETATYKQTLKNKNTSENMVWDTVLEDLKMQLDARIFSKFLDGTTLVSTDDNTAVIGTPYAYARDWIENRLSAKVKRGLGVDCVRCVILDEPAA